MTEKYSTSTQPENVRKIYQSLDETKQAMAKSMLYSQLAFFLMAQKSQNTENDIKRGNI